MNGEGRDVYKRPKTQSAKNSKRGRLKLVRLEDGTFQTHQEHEPGDDVLREFYRDGELLYEDSLATIRQRSA